jgi:IclR family transcriptional regulator, acetate operon repressor
MTRRQARSEVGEPRAATEAGRLTRPLQVLDAVVDCDEPCTAASIAEQLGIPVSTAFRIVAALIDNGLLQRSPAGEIRPGARLVHLGLRALSRWERNRELEMVTIDLAARIPESVSAGLLIGDEIVLVARQEPDSPLRVVAQVGDIIAPHVSALGKAILAQLPPERTHAVLDRAVGPDRAEAVATQLADELQRTRECGFAVDEGQYALGQRCRAVPLIDSLSGVYGGLSVAGPAARFSLADADAAAELLREAAASVTPLPRPRQPSKGHS